MEEAHRKILRTNRTNIINNVANPLDVNEDLFIREIFTESMKQEVEAEKTAIAKMRKILDTVPRRGQKAFRQFCEALVETRNEEVAYLLDPSLSSKGKGLPRGTSIQETVDGDVLPTNWPDKDAMTQKIQVRTCDPMSPLVRDQWNKSASIYKMSKVVRGKCLIIGNKVFSGPLAPDKDGVMRVILPSRHGTEADEDGLKNLFQQLHFKVELHNEKTAAEITEILAADVADPMHREAECFVFVILTHGTQQGVYGVDGNIVPLDYITKFYDAEHCPNLANKPKIFLIQACKGETMDHGSSASLDTMDSGESASGPVIEDLSHQLKELNVTDAQMEQAGGGTAAIPTKKDMLVASATHPGYVSMRNQRYGSWFIQAVIYVFMHFAHEEQLIDLLQLVNRLVARGRSDIKAIPEKQIMQAAQYTTSLDKKLFFFPGVVDAALS